MYHVLEGGWSEKVALEGRIIGVGDTPEVAVRNAAERATRAKSYEIRFHMDHGLYLQKKRDPETPDSFRNNYTFEREVTGKELLGRLAAKP